MIKRKGFLIFALSVLPCVGIVWCGSTWRPGNQDPLDLLLVAANQRHEAVAAGSVDFTVVTAPIPADWALTQQEIQNLVHREPYIAQKPLTHQEALADIDMAFRLLKSIYAGYQQFGGDDVFQAVKAQTEEQILQLDVPTPANLEEILLETLSVIQDLHFTVNGQKVSRHWNYYTNSDLSVTKNGEEYAVLWEGRSHSLLSMDNDSEISKYAKPSLDEQGQLVYRIGCLSDDEHYKKDVTLHTDYGDIPVSLTKVATQMDRSASAVTFEEINGIPVLGISSFGDMSAKKELETWAPILAQAPVAILDLRGNQGGQPELVDHFLDHYSPESFTRNYIGAVAVKYSFEFVQIHNRFMDFAFQSDYDSLPDDLQYFMDGNPKKANLDNPFWDIKKFAQPKVQTDQVLFVLMDAQCASSAENLIAKLHYQTNVVFAGTNTMGSTSFNTGLPLALPNSQIALTMGSTMIQLLGDRSGDGIGFEPDIWLDKDALERTLEFIEESRRQG